MTRTLRRERIQKFIAILTNVDAVPNGNYTAYELEQIIDTWRGNLAVSLADAAASRTEAQEKQAYSIGSEQLSWELYNAIKDTKYIGKATRIEMRKVLEINLGKEDDMRNKQWDFAHDFPAELAPIVEKLERALGLRNMMRDERAQEVYRWIADQEAAGKTIAKFADWALQPERAQFVGKYKKTPEAIKTDWQIAFENKHRSSADDEGI